MAKEPAPAWPGAGAAGRARASVGVKLHAAGGHSQERGIEIAHTDEIFFACVSITRRTSLRFRGLYSFVSKVCSSSAHKLRNV
jgi:hypothetical protein